MPRSFDLLMPIFSAVLSFDLSFTKKTGSPNGSILRSLISLLCAFPTNFLGDILVLYLRSILALEVWFITQALWWIASIRNCSGVIRLLPMKCPLSCWILTTAAFLTILI